MIAPALCHTIGDPIVGIVDFAGWRRRAVDIRVHEAMDEVKEVQSHWQGVIGSTIPFR